MSNFFLTDKNGTRHSFNEQQIKALAAQGKILPTTPLETDTGYKGVAGQIPGLIFNTIAPPLVNQTMPQSPPAPVVEKSTGSSWQVTLIGIVLIMVVGSIGKMLIESTSSKTEPKQVQTDKPVENATVAETPVNKPQFTAAEQAEIDKFCEEYGIDVKRKFSGGLTMLHVVTSPAIAKFLISEGADVDAKADNGFTPFFMATVAKNFALAQVLISAGADVNAKDSNGQTALHFAATAGNVEIIEFLVAHGANVNAKERRGLTPLHVAAFLGNVEIAKILVSHGANVKAESNNGATPLLAAKGQAMIQYLSSVGGK